MDNFVVPSGTCSSKLPSDPELVPVAVPGTSTVTPGRAVPWESVTLPETARFCAWLSSGTKRASSAKASMRSSGPGCNLPAGTPAG